MPTDAGGLFGRARAKFGPTLYKLDIGYKGGRAVRMLATGQWKLIRDKLLRRRAAASAVPGVVAASASEPAGPPLFVAGHINAHGGYDHLVCQAVAGLSAAGVRVLRDPRAFMDPKWGPNGRVPAKTKYAFDQPRLAVIPPHLLYRFWPGRQTAAWTMWETDTLPSGSTEPLNRCGLLLIPSRWGVECFRANGVTTPAEVVPLGYDPAVFSPRAASGGPEVCTFGTAGALDEGGLRKNVQRVIDLFVKAFPDRKDVRLKVKITPRSPMVNTRGDSRVEVVNAGLTPPQLADWYRDLTCYVNASYGEGFGLHLLEAMGCGVPLISTTFSAVGEVFDPMHGYEIDYKLIEAKNRVYAGRWADPDNDHLIARMREVYADRDTAAQFGAAAARRAPAFSWAAAIEKLVAALTKHGYLPPTAAEKRAA